MYSHSTLKINKIVIARRNDEATPSHACGSCNGDEVAALPTVARNDIVFMISLQQTYLIRVPVQIIAGRAAHNAFEYPVKVGDAAEAAFVGDDGDTFVLVAGEFFAGFVDAHFVQERYEGMSGMFFKVTAKGLGCHAGFARHVVKRDGLTVMLQDVVVDIADADALYLVNALRQGKIRQVLGF